MDDAYSAQVPTAIQKIFKETDQRVSLLFNTLEGSTLRLFPIPDDENNKWVSSNEFREGALQVTRFSLRKFYQNRLYGVYGHPCKMIKNQESDFSKSQQLLDAIKKTQIKYGGDTMLSEDKIQLKILYNRYDIFKKLFEYYMYASTLMFLLLIFQIFKDRSTYINLISQNF